jgi:hypothetical protein
MHPPAPQEGPAMPEGLYSWREQAERSNISEHEVLRSCTQALSLLT